MVSPLALRTLTDVLYVFLLLVTICAFGLTCTALLSQAVRTSPTQSWIKNNNTLVIGAGYVAVLVASLFLCTKRRIAVRQKMNRISDSYQSSPHDVPQPVRVFVMQEYVRACLIAFTSLPTEAYHEGWGRPGTKYADVFFRHALLDTIPEIAALVQTILPSHPPLKPHSRISHHFRHVVPLLPTDGDGLSVLHYYDAAIQLARTSSREPTEEEFEIGMRAVEEIKRSLNECRAEMLNEVNSESFSGGVFGNGGLDLRTGTGSLQQGVGILSNRYFLEPNTI